MKYVLIITAILICSCGNNSVKPENNDLNKSADTNRSALSDTAGKTKRADSIFTLTEVRAALTNPPLWKIDDSTAKAMIAKYNDDFMGRGYLKGKDRKYMTLRKAIKDQYSGMHPKFKDFDARYVSDEDELRYRRLRGLRPNSDPTLDSGAAKGCATEILRVIFDVTVVDPKTNKKRITSDTAYYDYIDSCPPPYPADCGNKGGHGNPH